MSLEGAKFICLDEAGNHGEMVLAKGRKFTVGYYVSCDFVLADKRAKGVHCEIDCDAFGRVTIRNLSPDKPILVNGSVVEIRRILLNNSKLSILDKEYLWLFPKSSSNEFEDLPIEDASTPQKLIGIPEQPPNSCPDFKLHRELPKRLTVHNFAYCIQSDEEGNTSSESNDESTSEDTKPTNKSQNELEIQNKDDKAVVSNEVNIKDQEGSDATTKLEEKSERRSITPEPKDKKDSGTILMETPKMNLINCTKDKENKSTQKKNKQVLTMCHQSDVVITSFSPRETGVKIEKSFATIVKPKVLVTKTPATPKSVYSTPKSELNDSKQQQEDDEDDKELLTFHTPSTSKKSAKVLKNSSMHLIDLTTPNKLRPASPYLKSALKASAKKNLKQNTSDKTSTSSKLNTEEQLGLSALLSTPALSDVKNSPLETPNSVISVSSSTDTSSIIEVTSDGSNNGITPSSVSGLTTPVKTQTRTGACTPKRTPQSLMKRALLTSVKKQNAPTTPQRNTNTTTATTNTTTPRRESINRIPLRSNLAFLRTPVTPQASTGDKSTTQLPRRHSISTPTRKSISARSRFDYPTSSSSVLATASPSSSTNRLTSRRSSLNPIAAARALPTSTPVSGANYNSALRTRAACKTSPLHKVRKSIGGIPLSSHISKARRSIVLPASTSKITSIKEKSPQQVMSERLVSRARKSLCVTPISARSRYIVTAAKTPPQPPSSILKDRTVQSARKPERKAVLFADKQAPDTGKVDDLSRTFIIDSDEEENEVKEKQNEKSKDATSSPENDVKETKKEKEKLEDKSNIEIPVDVEEITHKTKDDKQNDKQVKGQEEKEKTPENLEDNTQNEQEIKEQTTDIKKKETIVTEESFAEIINVSQETETEGNKLTKTIEILDSPKESSQTESQENFAEAVEEIVEESTELNKTKPTEDAETESIEITDKEEKTEVLETGFGEESIVEIIETSNNENVKESFITETPEANNESTTEIVTQNDIPAIEIQKDIPAIETSNYVHNIHQVEVPNNPEIPKSKTEYKPIVEDITLEGSLIEKEANTSKQPLYEDITMEGSLIEDKVKSEEIKENSSEDLTKETDAKVSEISESSEQTANEENIEEKEFEISDILETSQNVGQQEKEENTEVRVAEISDILETSQSVEEQKEEITEKAETPECSKEQALEISSAVLEEKKSLEESKIITSDSFKVQNIDISSSIIEEAESSTLENSTTLKYTEEKNVQENTEATNVTKPLETSQVEIENATKPVVPEILEKPESSKEQNKKSSEVIEEAKSSEIVEERENLAETLAAVLDEDLENTNKLLEEIEDVLNKSDEIKQKHLIEMEEANQESEKPLTEEFESEKLTQENKEYSKEDEVPKVSAQETEENTTQDSEEVVQNETNKEALSAIEEGNISDESSIKISAERAEQIAESNESSQTQEKNESTAEENLEKKESSKNISQTEEYIESTVEENLEKKKTELVVTVKENIKEVKNEDLSDNIVSSSEEIAENKEISNETEEIVQSSENIEEIKTLTSNQELDDQMSENVIVEPEIAEKVKAEETEIETVDESEKKTNIIPQQVIESLKQSVVKPAHNSEEKKVETQETSEETKSEINMENEIPKTKTEKAQQNEKEDIVSEQKNNASHSEEAQKTEETNKKDAQQKEESEEIAKSSELSSAIKKKIETAANSFTPRRSTRRASQSTETSQSASELTFTPRRSARRASMSAETNSTQTPTKRTTRRASLSVVDETPLTPKPISKRRPSISLDDETPQPSTSKTPRAKTPRKQLEQRMVIPEEMDEVVGATIIEEEEVQIKEKIEVKVKKTRRCSVTEAATNTPQAKTPLKQVEESKEEVPEVVDNAIEEKAEEVVAEQKTEKKTEDDVEEMKLGSTEKKKTKDNLESESTAESIENQTETKKSQETTSITDEVSEECTSFKTLVVVKEVKMSAERSCVEDVKGDPTLKTEDVTSTEEVVAKELSLEKGAETLEDKVEKSVSAESPVVEEKHVEENVTIKTDDVTSTEEEVVKEMPLEKSAETLENTDEKPVNAQDSSNDIPTTKSADEIVEGVKETLMVEGEVDIVLTKDADIPAVAETAKNEGNVETVNETKQNKETADSTEYSFKNSDLVKTPTKEMSSDDQQFQITTPITKKFVKIIAESPKTPQLSGMREMLKTPKAEAPTPRLGGIRDLVRSPKDTVENEEEETEKLAVVADLVKTPKAEISTPKAKEQVTIQADTAKTPQMTGMRELLKTPKAEAQTPRLGGIRELVRSPKESQDNEEEEMEKLAVVAELVKTPVAKKQVTITADSPQTPLMTGMRELLKTPKCEMSTPKLVGIRNLVQTPKTKIENEQEETEKLAVVAELVKTTKSADEIVEGVKETLMVEGEVDIVLTKDADIPAVAETAKNEGNVETVNETKQNKETADSTEYSFKNSDLVKTSTNEMSSDDQQFQLTTPITKKFVKIIAESPKTPQLSGMREMLKTPKAEAPTPRLGGIRDLVRSPKDIVENEEEETEKLAVVADLVKTPKAEISTPKAKKQVTIQADTAKTPQMTGMRELLKTPKAEAQTPRLGGIRELVRSPKESQDNEEEEMEKLAVVAELVKTPVAKKQVTITADSPQTPLMTGMRELLKTPKCEMSTPKLVGIRNLVQTPKTKIENEQEETEKLAVVAELVKTPQTNKELETEGEKMPLGSLKNEQQLKGVKELLKTPKSCSTPRFKGMRELMQTPKMNSTPLMAGVKELLQSPAETEPENNEVIAEQVSTENNEDIPATSSKNVEHLKGVKELMKTPKNSSTPRLKGIRELMQTPKMSSTPVMAGLKELMDSSANQQNPQELDKYLRTPTAKNIMIPSMPSSAIIEKSSDSIEISKEYDLNATHEGETANLEDLFKTPVASRFVERTTASYYGEGEEEHDDTVEKINKTETLQDTLNKSAEEAFDKMVGQESQIQTPIRKVYPRKSFALQTPQPQSPFSAADVLSDLPKTDVEEWIETLEQAEPPTILEDDEGNVTELGEELKVEEEDLPNESLKVEEEDDEEVEEVSISEHTKQNISANDDSIIPETCTKVYLTENSLTNTDSKTLALNNTKDPLLATNIKKLKEIKSRPATPIDAEISGINLLDQTIDSVQEETSMLDEPLQVEEPSMFEEPLMVSDNESEANNTLNEAVAADDTNDLSEPLLVSDSEDLNQSQESDKNDVIEIKKEAGVSKFDSKEQEKSMLDKTSNVSLTEDPLETTTRQSDNSVVVVEVEKSLIETQAEEKSTNDDNNKESVDNSVVEIEDEKSLIETLAEEKLTKDENNKESAEEEKPVLESQNINEKESSKETETKESATSDIETKIIINADTKINILGGESLLIEDSPTKESPKQETEKPSENREVLEVEVEVAETLNIEEQEPIVMENKEESKASKEISIKETKVLAAESEDIFIDSSVSEICEETSITKEEEQQQPESKKKEETEKEDKIVSKQTSPQIDECQDIFMDNSNIDESFADEANNGENDVENESAMVEVSTKEVMNVEEKVEKIAIENKETSAVESEESKEDFTKLEADAEENKKVEKQEEESSETLTTPVKEKTDVEVLQEETTYETSKLEDIIEVNKEEKEVIADTTFEAETKSSETSAIVLETSIIQQENIETKPRETSLIEKEPSAEEKQSETPLSSDTEPVEPNGNKEGASQQPLEVSELCETSLIAEEPSAEDKQSKTPLSSQSEPVKPEEIKQYESQKPLEVSELRETSLIEQESTETPSSSESEPVKPDEIKEDVSEKSLEVSENIEEPLIEQKETKPTETSTITLETSSIETSHENPLSFGSELVKDKEIKEDENGISLEVPENIEESITEQTETKSTETFTITTETSSMEQESSLEEKSNETPSSSEKQTEISEIYQELSIKDIATFNINKQEEELGATTMQSSKVIEEETEHITKEEPSPEVKIVEKLEESDVEKVTEKEGELPNTASQSSNVFEEGTEAQPIESPREISAKELEESETSKLDVESQSVNDNETKEIENDVTTEIIATESSESKEVPSSSASEEITLTVTESEDNTEIESLVIEESSKLTDGDTESQATKEDGIKQTTNELTTEVSESVELSSNTEEIPSTSKDKSSDKLNESDESKLLTEIATPEESSVKIEDEKTKVEKIAESFVKVEEVSKTKDESKETIIATEIVKSYDFEIKINYRSPTKETKIEKTEEQTAELNKIEVEEQKQPEVPIEEIKTRSTRRKRTASESSQDSTIGDEQTTRSRRDRRKIIKKQSEDKLEKVQEEDVAEQQILKDKKSKRKRTASESSQGSVNDVDISSTTRRTRRRIQKTPVEETVVEEKEENVKQKEEIQQENIPQAVVTEVTVVEEKEENAKQKETIEQDSIPEEVSPQAVITETITEEVPVQDDVLMLQNEETSTEKKEEIVMKKDVKEKEKKDDALVEEQNDEIKIKNEIPKTSQQTADKHKPEEKEIQEEVEVITSEEPMEPTTVSESTEIPSNSAEEASSTETFKFAKEKIEIVAAEVTETKEKDNQEELTEQQVKRTRRKATVLELSQASIQTEGTLTVASTTDKENETEKRLSEKETETKKKLSDIAEVPESEITETVVEKEKIELITSEKTESKLHNDETESIEAAAEEVQIIAVEEPREQSLRRGRRKPTVSESSQGSVHDDELTTRGRKTRRKVQKTPVEDVLVEEQCVVIEEKENASTSSTINQEILKVEEKPEEDESKSSALAEEIKEQSVKRSRRKPTVSESSQGSVHEDDTSRCRRAHRKVQKTPVEDIVVEETEEQVPSQQLEETTETKEQQVSELQDQIIEIKEDVLEEIVKISDNTGNIAESIIEIPVSEQKENKQNEIPVSEASKKQQRDPEIIEAKETQEVLKETQEVLKETQEVLKESQEVLKETHDETEETKDVGVKRSRRKANAPQIIPEVATTSRRGRHKVQISVEEVTPVETLQVSVNKTTAAIVLPIEEVKPEIESKEDCEKTETSTEDKVNEIEIVEMVSVANNEAQEQQQHTEVVLKSSEKHEEVEASVKHPKRGGRRRAEENAKSDQVVETVSQEENEHQVHVEEIEQPSTKLEEHKEIETSAKHHPKRGARGRKADQEEISIDVTENKTEDQEILTIEEQPELVKEIQATILAEALVKHHPKRGGRARKADKEEVPEDLTEDETKEETVKESISIQEEQKHVVNVEEPQEDEASVKHHPKRGGRARKADKEEVPVDLTEDKTKEEIVKESNSTQEEEKHVEEQQEVETSVKHHPKRGGRRKADKEEVPTETTTSVEDTTHTTRRGGRHKTHAYETATTEIPKVRSSSRNRKIPDEQPATSNDTETDIINQKELEKIGEVPTTQQQYLKESKDEIPTEAPKEVVEIPTEAPKEDVEASSDIVVLEDNSEKEHPSKDEHVIDEDKPLKKPVKRTRTASETSQGSVAGEKPTKRRARHHVGEIEVIQENKEITEPQNENLSDKVEEVEEKPQKTSRRRGATAKHEDEERHVEVPTKSHRRKGAKHDDNEELHHAKEEHVEESVEENKLSEVKVTEVDLQPENVVEKVSSPKKESPVGTTHRKGRTKATVAEEEHNVEEHDEQAVTKKKKATTTHEEHDHEESSAVGKRRVGRRKHTAEEHHTEEDAETHTETTTKRRHVGRRKQGEEKQHDEDHTEEKESDHVESPAEKHATEDEMKPSETGLISGKRRNIRQKYDAEEQPDTEVQHVESTETTHKRRVVGRKKHDNETEHDHQIVANIISVDIENQNEQQSEEEPKKGKGRRKKIDHHSEEVETEQPTTSHSSETKHRGRKRKESHTDIHDYTPAEKDHHTKLTKEEETKLDIASTHSETPQRATTAPTTKKALKGATFEHITAESQETAEDTPGRRARNVPQRKAATAYHNYDETSDSDVKTKPTKKKTDSPRKSLEVAKTPPTATITTAPIINASPSPSSTTSTTTARGRTRKPTAKVQQFLEEERAKAETPKKRGLLAASAAIEQVTPQRTPARGGRKASNVETDNIEGTPHAAKGRGKGRLPAKEVVETPVETPTTTTVAPVAVVEEKTLDLQATTPPAQPAKVRKGGRKAKIVAEEHQKSDEPPAKKSPLELENEKQESSSSVEGPTPTRIAGRRNAAAAAKARIEEDALAAAAIDPPKRARAKKAPATKVSTPVVVAHTEAVAEEENLAKPKTSPLKRDHRIASATTIEGEAEDSEDHNETEAADKTAPKRARKAIATAATATTTDSPAVPAKKGRKAKTAEVAESDTPVVEESKTSRGRGRGRKNVNEDNEAAAATTSSHQNTPDIETPTLVETSEAPVKRGRTRRK